MTEARLKFGDNVLLAGRATGRRFDRHTRPRTIAEIPEADLVAVTSTLTITMYAGSACMSETYGSRSRSSQSRWAR